jgi:hypothetical protein
MQASDAIGGEIYGVATVLEKVSKVGGDVLVVFDDENAHGTFLIVGLRPRRCGEVPAATPEMRTKR